MKKRFTRKIEATLESKGLKRKDVAEMLNIAPSTFSNYLHGHQKPSKNFLNFIENYLGLEIEFKSA